MKSDFEILEIVKQTIKKESESIKKLLDYVDNEFVSAVKEIFNSKGRVIISGIGKSAIIGNKIVATLNSTGTPAIFMHAAEAIHGDLGIIQPDDVVICMSKSGNTPEIKVLTPLVKSRGNKLIALVGNTDSYLAKSADYVLNCTVEKEACPNNLAPTSSTTAQLVLGDALAVALLYCKNFTAQDFARYHPGGSLGKRLYLKVSDLYVKNEKPQVSLSTPLRDTLMEITSKRLGCTVVAEEDNILGIITDGDLRRMLNNKNIIDTQTQTAEQIMTKNPKTITADAFAVEAFTIMQQHHITQLIVTDENNKYLGIIHIHDLITEGII
ncbi:MAG: KpsF/GutQ family sugar-phosphate isomerase [Bacteroidales bacterium]|nr:KpsF/GutQ family sugar-phosphate isomerase [Bacteroidales bacterium]MEE0883426.1 KpsF/GutQ family sugar-phosphate isomerase [Bacteroidales bacterium]MEE1118310.1 KpsF/GutQ family sugar-phosphate isomerase [Bacteroidales bacterium]MEE1302588.1 KpsF/GutQ family sugar-phosphate isomerase [Bacteroidales bacterium]